MGLLDDLTKQVVGATGGGADHANMVGAAIDLINQHGGIAGLAQTFQQGGLGHLMQSWISTGPNPAINPAQLTQVLGTGKIGAIAQQYGINPATAATTLAAVLPTLIDKLTPQGSIPAASAGAGASPLGGLLKELGLG